MTDYFVLFFIYIRPFIIEKGLSFKDMSFMQYTQQFSQLRVATALCANRDSTRLYISINQIAHIVEIKAETKITLSLYS